MSVMNHEKAALNFEYLVDSFLCYPCGQQSIKEQFTNLLRAFRQNLSENEWKQFLNKPIFLPAVARKVERIVVENPTFSR